MKIFSAKQSKQLDEITIGNHFKNSWELMEQAASACFTYLTKHFTTNHSFAIFCGQGNNGGDGLALARMLFQAQYPVKVFVFKTKEKGSADFELNFKKLPLHPTIISDFKGFKNPDQSVIIDALLGSGLNRPLQGVLAEVVKELNDCRATKISIDINTGLFAEDNAENDLNTVFKSDITLALDHPKLALCKHTSAHVCGKIAVLDIGLDKIAKAEMESVFSYVEAEEIRHIYKKRNPHTFKNRNGHALLIAGSNDKPGAALLAAVGALRSGVGLLSLQSTKAVKQALLPNYHEVMYTDLSNVSEYDGVGIGPGLGTDKVIETLLLKILDTANRPLVLDADALNIIASNNWLKKVPCGSVLTPHPGELKRLLEVENLSEEYIEQVRGICQSLGIHILVKGKISVFVRADGMVQFFDFGHEVLARGGSGDLLTGILSSLMAQGYPPEQSVALGVYLHGLSAKIAASKKSIEWLLPSDIAVFLDHAFETLK